MLAQKGERLRELPKKLTSSGQPWHLTQQNKQMNKTVCQLVGWSSCADQTKPSVVADMGAIFLEIVRLDWLMADPDRRR
jgi:hypothetical protein